MSLLGKLLGQETKGTVVWLETDDLAMLLAGSTAPMVIDVRGPGEFTGPLGHIEAAHNIPLDHIPARTAAVLAEQRAVVLVCHTDRRSAAAAEHLRRAGGTDIAVLRGGMVAWRSRFTA